MNDIQHPFSQGCTVVWHIPIGSATQTYDTADELVRTVLLRSNTDELLDALDARVPAMVLYEGFAERLMVLAETVMAQRVAFKLTSLQVREKRKG